MLQTASQPPVMAGACRYASMTIIFCMQVYLFSSDGTCRDAVLSSITRDEGKCLNMGTHTVGEHVVAPVRHGADCEGTIAL